MSSASDERITREVQTDWGWGQLIYPETTTINPEPALEPDTDFEEVILSRTNQSERLGLTLYYYGNPSGSSVEVYVSAVHQGGIVEKDGRIQEGDKLLKVNGCDVVCKEQVEKSVASDSQISFLVARPKYNDETFVRHLGFCPHSKVLQANIMEIKRVVLGSATDEMKEKLEDVYKEVSDPEDEQHDIKGNNINYSTQTRTKETKSCMNGHFKNAFQDGSPVHKGSVNGRCFASEKIDPQRDIIKNLSLSPKLHRFVPSPRHVAKEGIPETKRRSLRYFYENHSMRSKSVDTCYSVNGDEDLESVHTYESISDWESEDHLYNIPYDSSIAGRFMPFSLYLNGRLSDSKGSINEVKDPESCDKENKRREHLQRLRNTEISNMYFDPTKFHSVENWLEKTAAWQGSPKKERKNRKLISDFCNSGEIYCGQTFNFSQGIPRSEGRTGLCDISTEAKPLMIDSGLQVNMESDTLSMISCDSCRKFLLATSPEEQKSLPNSPRKKLTKEREPVKITNGTDRKSHEKCIGVVPTETMYTTAENLEHTIRVQQKLFKQALLMRHFKAKQNGSVSSLKSSNGLLFNYMSRSQAARQKDGQEDKDDGGMEWKVKKRPDGSRYIARRPVRNRILKEREQKIAKERAGPSTDDDSTSELKMGRYWSKEQRKKHLERSRERRKRQDEIIRTASQDRGQNGSHDEPNILELSHRKMEKRKTKKGYFDDFITVQEILVHGNRAGQENLIGGLLSVTTV